jgi:hypothetical protein
LSWRGIVTAHAAPMLTRSSATLLRARRMPRYAELLLVVRHRAAGLASTSISSTHSAASAATVQ